MESHERNNGPWDSDPSMQVVGSLHQMQNGSAWQSNGLVYVAHGSPVIWKGQILI
jgi:hypothetical protein